MRSLVQPHVLKAAAVGAAMTSLASYPRLILWTERPYQLWFLTLTLAWTSFVLWSFVFAWHSQYTHRPVLVVRTNLRLWGIATVAGLIGAAVLARYIDPVLRPLVPDDYPATVESWLAMTLFLLAFDQLFLCLAPFAFFLRLSHRPSIAASLTVLFGVFLVYLKARAWPGEFSPAFILELFAWRVVAGFLSVSFFLEGGALLTMCWIFLLQLRHLIYIWTAVN